MLGALPPFKHGRDDAAAMLKGLLARMRCVLHACFVCVLFVFFVCFNYLCPIPVGGWMDVWMCVCGYQSVGGDHVE